MSFRRGVRLGFSAVLSPIRNEGLACVRQGDSQNAFRPQRAADVLPRARDSRHRPVQSNITRESWRTTARRRRCCRSVPRTGSPPGGKDSAGRMDFNLVHRPAHRMLLRRGLEHRQPLVLLVPEDVESSSRRGQGLTSPSSASEQNIIIDRAGVVHRVSGFRLPSRRGRETPFPGLIDSAARQGESAGPPHRGSTRLNRIGEPSRWPYNFKRQIRSPFATKSMTGRYRYRARCARTRRPGTRAPGKRGNSVATFLPDQSAGHRPPRRSCC